MGLVNHRRLILANHLPTQVNHPPSRPPSLQSLRPLSTSSTQPASFDLVPVLDDWGSRPSVTHLFTFKNVAVIFKNFTFHSLFLDMIMTLCITLNATFAKKNNKKNFTTSKSLLLLLLQRIITRHYIVAHFICLFISIRSPCLSCFVVCGNTQVLTRNNVVTTSRQWFMLTPSTCCRIFSAP